MNSLRSGKPHCLTLPSTSRRGGRPGTALRNLGRYLEALDVGGERISDLLRRGPELLGAVHVGTTGTDRAAATKQVIDELGGGAMTAVGDLTDPIDNERCVQAAADALGGLDTLINNVALPHGGGSPATLSLDDWDQVMEVNLRATLLTTRHSVPHLISAGGGSIVNISSIAAIRGFGSGAYAASKSALLGLTKDWAYVLGRDSIRVNCILPGHVYTPMGDQGGEEVRERRRRAGLLPVEGVAWDIAWPAVFLASDESRWVTGVELPVDAGTTSTAPWALQTLNERR